MGRCYEFGVVVGAGCEQPMVVTAEGGACACPDCGTVCRGRFDGCASVLARPGYSPLGAPAREGVVAAVDDQPMDDLGMPDVRLADVVARLSASHDRLLDALEQLAERVTDIEKRLS